MKWLFGLAAGVAALLFPIWSSAAVVQVDGDLLEGVRSGGLDVYKGVPFAAPPVGDLRWKLPGPAPAWRGVRKADAFAPACIQSGVSMPGETPTEISEDRLYLNIWAPKDKPPARLPVMVFIYGGGFTALRGGT